MAGNSHDGTWVKGTRIRAWYDAIRCRVSGVRCREGKEKHKKRRKRDVSSLWIVNCGNLRPDLEVRPIGFGGGLDDSGIFPTIWAPDRPVGTSDGRFGHSTGWPNGSPRRFARSTDRFASSANVFGAPTGQFGLTTG